MGRGQNFSFPVFNYLISITIFCCRPSFDIKKLFLGLGLLRMKNVIKQNWNSESKPREKRNFLFAAEPNFFDLWDPVCYWEHYSKEWIEKQFENWNTYFCTIFLLFGQYIFAYQRLGTPDMFLFFQQKFREKIRIRRSRRSKVDSGTGGRHSRKSKVRGRQISRKSQIERHVRQRNRLAPTRPSGTYRTYLWLFESGDISYLILILSHIHFYNLSRVYGCPV